MTPLARKQKIIAFFVITAVIGAIIYLLWPKPDPAVTSVEQYTSSPEEKNPYVSVDDGLTAAATKGLNSTQAAAAKYAFLKYAQATAVKATDITVKKDSIRLLPITADDAATLMGFGLRIKGTPHTAVLDQVTTYRVELKVYNAQNRLEFASGIVNGQDL